MSHTTASPKEGTTMPDPTPAPADRLLVAWTGDIPRIKAFLDAHGAYYDELTVRGHDATWTVTIHQLTPKLGGNRVKARIGDVLVFRSALLEVEKREPRRRIPPPATSSEPGRRARRDRSGGVR